MSKRTTKLFGGLLALVIGGAAWGISQVTDSETGTHDAAPPPVDVAPTRSDAPRSAEPDEALAPYERSKFGQAWKDVDRNGCDTRNDILGRDLTELTFKPGTRGCVVLSGTLKDIYSGKTIHFVRGQGTSELVQIDHIVSLRWAWDHGAAFWTDEEREEFANDPANLVAASGEANASKREFPPSQWVPEDPAGRCRFAQAWTDVTKKYDLEVPEVESSAVRTLIDACPSLSHG